MTISDFKDKFAAIAVPDAVLSDTDVLVLIWYLEKTRGVLATEGEEEKMVFSGVVGRARERGKGIEKGVRPGLGHQISEQERRNTQED
ncbi:hypothetical protein BC936DRAFT_148412 [Jimgerdemannia flammicorona]|uniref:Uncharacterized protein n=1 Tax=Jimgerdemannia flammicorona TaxID=994334 RepID=A0A433DKM7_9FUNG|nr:hypothetical protein BC936DRAFT_148412 [Jimgerdemannia flammicorona]